LWQVVYHREKLDREIRIFCVYVYEEVILTKATKDLDRRVLSLSPLMLILMIVKEIDV